MLREQTAAARWRRLRRFGFRFSRSVFRSESKAPKTPPSHGFWGLAAIKPGANSGPPRGLRLWLVACGFSAAARLFALPVAFTALMTRPRNPSTPAAPLWVWHPALRFQKRIQGPKTRPIARFNGLGCYQSRSGKSASWSARRRAFFWQPRRFGLHARRFSRGRAARPLAALRALGGSGWLGLARGLPCKRLGAGCRAAGLAHRLALLFQLPGICALRLRLQAAHCIAARPAVLAMAGWPLPGRPVRRAACLHAAHRLAARAGIQRIWAQLNRAAFVRGRARPVGIRQRAIRPPAFVGLPKSGRAHQRRKQRQRTRQKTHRHIWPAARQSAAFEKKNGPENSTQDQAASPPENGSIARFQGLGRYRTGSKKAYRGLPWRFAAFGLPRRKAQTEQRGQTAANEWQRTNSSQTAPALLLWISRLSLIFQERI